MTHNTIHWDDLGITAEYTVFGPQEGVEEIHAMLHSTQTGSTFLQQYRNIQQAQQRLTALTDSSIVMRRLFVSDATNQVSLIDDIDNTTSIIQQPPLNGSKIATWIYLHKGESNYTHLWDMTQVVAEGNSYQQTAELLSRYEKRLDEQGATLAENCIRTWFYVRDVDTQYRGLVEARRENFEQQGLIPTTHYIASTGIHGLPANTRAIIQMDTYAITDLEPGQQTYLYAPTHLNPTHQYGVTFERGVKVAYGDRSHIYISGTASINNRGEVEHVGDIVKQTNRMWENVETLLAEGGAKWDDVMQIIIYLRDIADYKTVNDMFQKKFPNIPKVMTYAPVCRPTWLIEMECIAITADGNKSFRPY